MPVNEILLKKDEMVYNFTFNVPKTCNYADFTDLYIECRAQFVRLDENGKPFFFVDVEHLNVSVCAVIKWETVSRYISEIAESHFNTLIKIKTKDANRDTPSL